MLPRSFLIAVVIVASLTGIVAAQDAPNATAEKSTEVEQPETCSQEITPTLRLCSADYIDGEAVLVLDSDTRDRVTVTEAVALREPRELNRQSFIVDGKTEIRMRVVSSGGRAGVTVDDGTILYGIPLQTSSTFVGGPFTASDTQAAGVGGALGVAFTTLYLVARRVYGRVEEPERIA